MKLNKRIVDERILEVNMKLLIGLLVLGAILLIAGIVLAIL
jgi:hypothetical protein